MRPQAASLVLGALVLSICGHELSNPEKHSRKAKHLTRNNVAIDTSNAPASRSNFINVQDGRSDLLILTNANTNLFGALNVTAELGLIFDITAGILGIFCGNGEYYVINLKSQLGACVEDRPSDHSWVARSRSFPAFFNSRRGLTDALEFGLRNGERSQRGTVSDEVALKLQWVMEQVSKGEYSTTRSRAFHRVVHLSRTLVATLRGSQKEALKAWGTQVIPIGISFRSLVVRLKTNGKVFANIDARVDILVNGGTTPRVIFYEQSSIQVFIHVFSRLRQHNVDVRPILREYSTDFNAFLGTLGGNSTRGVTGVTKVVGQYKALIDGRTTINELVPILLEYFRNSVNCKLSFEQFKREYRDLLNFLKTTGLACELPILVEYIEGIFQNRYEYKGVNEFLLVRLLFGIRGAPLQTVVKILATLRQVVKIEKSIGVLIYFLLQQTVDGSVNDVLALVPGVEIDRSVNILIPIFKGARLSCQDNLYRFLLSRPLLGRILSLIDNASDCINLEEIFRSPDFAPFASAITKLVARAIRRVNKDGPVTRFTIIQTYQPSGEIQNKGHHGAGTRYLNGHSKHLSHSVRHLKNHAHVKHHNKEKHHVHEKHHGHDKHKHGRKNRALRHDRGKHHEKRSKHTRRHRQ